jgi:hypothetical protein
MQLSAAILEHDPVPLRELLPDAPVELEEVVMRCLEKDVDKRYGNIAELAIALYPFAPRRSRISAERCYHALKNAGLDCPEFETEIQSVFPPSMGEVSVTSSAPARAMTGAGRNLTRANTRGAGKAPVQSSAPAALTQAEIESLRPNKTYKMVGLLAVLVMAATAALLVTQARSSDANGTAAASPAQAPRGAQGGPAAPGAKPGTVIDLDALTPAVSPGGPATASAQASAAAGNPSARSGQHAAPSQGQRRMVAPPAPAKPGSAPRKHDDDPDVGY